MIDTMIDAQGGVLQAIQGVLRDLLQKGIVDAWLVPMRLAAGAGGQGHSVVPMLVTDPAALDQADPLAPVLPINAARAASQLTLTGHDQTLGLVLRSCEIRALVELVKFQQANLDQALIAGVDCLGTYPVTTYQTTSDPAQLAGELLAAAPSGELQPRDGLAFRAACQMCEQPLPQGDHVALSFGLVGVEPGQIYLRARPDLAEALELAPAPIPAGRQAASATLVAARTQARDATFAQFRDRVRGNGAMDGLLAEFATCIRCHNCMTNCPICYCRECIFRTPTFEHESQLFYQWAERKGTVRMLPDTLLFHLTRLNHMVTSCVGCGLCTDACPVDIPVGTIFRSVAQEAQALFEYHPGRGLDEAAPVQEFREDELTLLGERPR